MRTTKTGIEIPEAHDQYDGAMHGLHILWKIINQMADIIDDMHDEIEKLKQVKTDNVTNDTDTNS